MVERRSLDVRGRAVVITGAAGGIGAALARRFGRAGARVALLDRDAAVPARGSRSSTAMRPCSTPLLPSSR